MKDGCLNCSHKCRITSLPLFHSAAHLRLLCGITTEKRHFDSAYVLYMKETQFEALNGTDWFIFTFFSKAIIAKIYLMIV